MDVLTAPGIRSLRVRANYFNQRALLWRASLHAEKTPLTSKCIGYSPPVVEYETDAGTLRSIVVSETDLPHLCGKNEEYGKQHLGWILRAREGDAQARTHLASAWHSFEVGAPEFPRETDFVVPCTSGHPHDEQDISQKGSILLKLSQQGYPVPDFVVLTAKSYADGSHRFEERLADALRQLEIVTMQKVGAGAEPLVFAIRCCTPTYIPGLMDTYLNVGVTESTLPALRDRYGTVGAHRMFLNNLVNLWRLIRAGQSFPVTAGSMKPSLLLRDIDSQIEELIDSIRKTDPSLIHDVQEQALFFCRQAYRHFEANRDLVLTLCRGGEHHPSLILQQMVCTVRHENAYAGVVSSRNTRTGIGMELQTAHNIFGEEMMTGTAEIDSTVFENSDCIKQEFPAVYHFVPHLHELEEQFESPVTIEFAVEATPNYEAFALLQLNQTGMSGRAAITAVIDMHKAGTISRRQVTELIRPYHIKQLTSDTIDQDDFSLLHPFCSGISVLPRSAVSARVYFTDEAALRAKSEGNRVCLCKNSFVPADTIVMREMDAVLSLTSAAVHVVTICQSLGIPALLSLETNGVKLLPPATLTNREGKQINEGDWITISSRRRFLYVGEARYKPARLLRYMRGEAVEMDPEEEKTFSAIAYAYRYYQQLTRGLDADQVSTLSEVTRLVNFELRAESAEARALVNSWFDTRETAYMQEVLRSDIGDHLGQSNVFEMLTLERKIRFFKLALERCLRDRISGFEAGAFMLGRFLCPPYPVAFWQVFSPAEVALLVNEWVLFEKYMQLLNKVGERKVLLARKEILKDGLEQLVLHPGNVQLLMPLKLSGIPLREAQTLLPDWADPQSVKVLELLQQPYKAFYTFEAKWSIAQLEKICHDANIPLPGPNDF